MNTNIGYRVISFLYVNFKQHDPFIFIIWTCWYYCVSILEVYKSYTLFTQNIVPECKHIQNTVISNGAQKKGITRLALGLAFSNDSKCGQLKEKTSIEFWYNDIKIDKNGINQEKSIEWKIILSIFFDLNKQHEGMLFF